MHVPVLLKEVIYALQPREGGIYVDGTVGAGGHATTDINSVVEAFAHNASLQASTLTGKAVKKGALPGSVLITANSDLTAKADASGGGASLAAGLAVMLPEASIGGITRAFVDGNTTVDSTQLNVSANSDSVAETSSISIGVGAAGGAGGRAPKSRGSPKPISAPMPMIRCRRIQTSRSSAATSWSTRLRLRRRRQKAKAVPPAISAWRCLPRMRRLPKRRVPTSVRARASMQMA